MVSILKKTSKLIGFVIIVLFANLCQSQDVGFPERGDEEESKQNAAVSTQLTLQFGATSIFDNFFIV